MAKDLNKVMLSGRLGKDVDFKYLPSGMAVAQFSVASGRRVKSRDGQNYEDQTEWFRVVAWDKLAETCSQYLRKGSHVMIEGRLQTRKYTDNQGVERYSTEVVANDMYMLDGKRQDSDNAGGSDDDWDNIETSAPANNRNSGGGSRNSGNPARSGSNSRSSRGYDDEMEPEDIPF